MFLFGEHRVKLDGKGRMRLPSAILEQVGLDLKTARDQQETDEPERIVFLAPGFEGTLRFFNESMMQEYLQEWKAMDIADPAQRAKLRTAHMGIRRIKLDSADRITLPKDVVEKYTSISSEEVVVYAYANVVEIWDADRFDAVSDVSPEEYSEVHQSRKAINEDPKDKD